MSWFEAKIHKGAAAHLLQNLGFADLDLAVAGASCAPGNSDGFQMIRFGQAAAGSSQAFQDGGELSRSQRSPELATGVAGESGTRLQEQRMNELLAALAESLGELSRLREKVLKNSTDDMLRLVLAIAEQVIHREVAADPTIIIATLQEALQAAIHSDAYHVKVHPDDLAIVMERKPLFLASISGLKNITLEGDATLSRGGCFIESELGQVDASIEGQLGELRRKLLTGEEGECAS